MLHTSATEYGRTLKAVAFDPDGQTVLTGNREGYLLRWSVAPAGGSVERLRLEVQVQAGLELNEQDDYRVLDSATWQARRDRLRALGSTP